MKNLLLPLFVSSISLMAFGNVSPSNEPERLPELSIESICFIKPWSAHQIEHVNSDGSLTRDLIREGGKSPMLDTEEAVECQNKMKELNKKYSLEKINFCYHGKLSKTWSSKESKNKTVNDELDIDLKFDENKFSDCLELEGTESKLKACEAVFFSKERSEIYKQGAKHSFTDIDKMQAFTKDCIDTNKSETLMQLCSDFAVKDNNLTSAKKANNSCLRSGLPHIKIQNCLDLGLKGEAGFSACVKMDNYDNLNSKISRCEGFSNDADRNLHDDVINVLENVNNHSPSVVNPE